MEITDLANKSIKICPRSITCKDKSGKTRGVVSGAVCYTSAPARVKYAFHQIVQASGVWSSGNASHLYIDGNKLYYLYDLSAKDFMEKYPDCCSDSHKEIVAQLQAVAEKAAEFMTVIPVRVLD